MLLPELITCYHQSPNSNVPASSTSVGIRNQCCQSTKPLSWRYCQPPNDKHPTQRPTKHWGRLPAPSPSSTPSQHLCSHTPQTLSMLMNVCLPHQTGKSISRQPGLVWAHQVLHSMSGLMQLSMNWRNTDSSLFRQQSETPKRRKWHFKSEWVKSFTHRSAVK